MTNSISASEEQFKTDILVVDDTPENVKLLSNLLTHQGYEVRKALDGQTALRAIATIIPDLILLDVNMPGMTGYEVCEYLKQNPTTASIPIIFLSASNSVSDKVKAFQVGAVDYVTKPFQFEEILARIQNQLTIRQLRAQLETQNETLQDTLRNLQKTQAQLIQQEKMFGLGQIVAGVAHEINNPISFIYGNLKPAREYVYELLSLIRLYQQEYPQPTAVIQAAMQETNLSFLMADLEKLLGSMQSGVDRIRAIVLALRIFSRLGESDIKTVNLHDGLESTLVLLQHRLRQEGDRPSITIIREYEELPLVTCYASQINQVFLNILNNAVDAIEDGIEKESFTEENPPQIQIKTTLSPSSKAIIIQIQDNGTGIPKQIESHVFEPFFTTKSVGHRTGLGLTTSYQIIVDRHHGQLTFQSSPQQGTAFMIEIPIHLANQPTTVENP
jgi:signal transduction histidine kinase